MKHIKLALAGLVAGSFALSAQASEETWWSYDFSEPRYASEAWTNTVLFADTWVRGANDNSSIEASWSNRNSVLVLNTEGDDLTYTPTNAASVATDTVLLDTEVFFVGSDTEPTISDSDVQFALFLKAPEDGGSTNLMAYVYDSATAGGKWVDLEGVTVADKTWAHVVVSLNYSGAISQGRGITVSVDGTTAYVSGSESETTLQFATGAETSSLNSVSFRGTGGIDSFTGKYYEDSSVVHTFNALAYLNGEVQAAMTQTTTGTASDSHTFSFAGYAGSEEDPVLVTKVVVVAADGTETEYAASYDEEDGYTFTPSSASIAYDPENVSIDVTVSFAGAPTDGDANSYDVLKVYYGPSDFYSANAVTVVGDAATTNSTTVTAAGTLTWTFPGTKTVDNTAYILSAVAPANGATASYASGSATVSVTLADALSADTTFVTATYVAGEYSGIPTWVDNNDGTYSVVDAVAAISGTPYATLASAVASASSGDTVTLLTNVTLTARVEPTVSMTIDLGGYTVARTGTSGNGSVFDVKSGTVVITNGVIDCTQDDTAIVADGVYAITARSGASVTLADLEVTVDSQAGACVYPFDGASVTIVSGTYANTTSDAYQYKSGWTGMAVNQANVASQLITITGGSFYQVDPSLGDDSWADGAGTFLASGYETVQDSVTGYYVVQAVQTEIEIAPEALGDTTYATEADALAAAANVVVKPSAAVEAALSAADLASYKTKFEVAATEVSSGVWKLTVNLKDDAKEAIQEQVDAATVGNALVAAGFDGTVSIAATPGFYYSFEWGTAVNARNNTTDSVLASGDTVTLTFPTNEGTSGFYKVKVTVTP